jgi:hypothetical protein
MMIRDMAATIGIIAMVLQEAAMAEEQIMGMAEDQIMGMAEDRIMGMADGQIMATVMSMAATIIIIMAAAAAAAAAAMAMEARAVLKKNSCPNSADLPSTLSGH